MRRVKLDQGEAFFDVSKDAARPFVVDIADKRVIAVGTQFSVRRDNNNIRVLVTEGRVWIERRGVSSKATETPTRRRIRKREPRRSWRPHRSTPHQYKWNSCLSWRSGYIMFRDTAAIWPTPSPLTSIATAPARSLSKIRRLPVFASAVTSASATLTRSCGFYRAAFRFVSSNAATASF